jgi:hypothetical protein
VVILQFYSSVYNSKLKKFKYLPKNVVQKDIYRGGWGEREGAEWVVREGVGAGGRNDPSIICTYE